MQIKLISKHGQDGQADTYAYLTGETKDDSEIGSSERINYNLGSIRNGGLEKLIEFSNSVNYFLLESALENQRDSIAGTRSYGTVYLITQMLKRWGISAELLFGSEDPNGHAMSNLLPSLLAALLDCDTRPDSSLSNIQRRFYFPKGVCFNASTIRELLHSIQISACDQDNGVSTAGIIKKDECPIYKASTEKLLSWATSDCGQWGDFMGIDGIRKIASLAGCLYNSIEKQTAMSWSVINEHLFELQAIRVEKGMKTFSMTTRLTTMQLNIFYRLEIKPTPLVVIERSEQPVITESKEEAKSYEAINLVFAPFFNANTKSITGSN
ncbi:MAG: hypothetical protein P9X24_02180 [Candidatus Hatepunaea meridiana]|nr:hypothetical protein [Candidatus Hatepunaea meridiana]